jgi:hypothetical protein
MSRHTALPMLLSTLLAAGISGAAPSSDLPPKFTLDVPASFGTSVTVKHYRRGQDILRSPPFKVTTSVPLTEYRGWYGPRNAGHSWTVRVYATLDPKVVAAYTKARDGFEADLDQGREFLGLNKSTHVFARFGRKHFRWGDAVSFLCSSYQDVPDRGFYVPDNGHLNYEVWGIILGKQYTVVASVSVAHPKLADWGPQVRVVNDIETLKQDRDYRLIEECPPDQFKPSLFAFDSVLDSLEIRHTSGAENGTKSHEEGRN